MAFDDNLRSRGLLHFTAYSEAFSAINEHILYRFLDNQKNTRSQFSVPGLQKIHRNLKKKKKIFNSHEGFFRKSPFCTFLLHKSWIWRTLGHVMDIFSYCHFHNASKECFWPKIFSNFMPRFKNFLAENILLKHYENGNKKKYL